MLGKRKLLAAAFVWGWAVLSPTPGIGDDGFIAGITDLPLMPGLREIPEATLIFDKPDGRLVKATAEGAAEATALWQFYEATLPQLGWRRRSRGKFYRDGEILRIHVEKNDSKLTVRFAIAPGSG